MSLNSAAGADRGRFSLTLCFGGERFWLLARATDAAMASERDIAESRASVKRATPAAVLACCVEFRPEPVEESESGLSLVMLGKTRSNGTHDPSFLRTLSIFCLRMLLGDGVVDTEMVAESRGEMSIAMVWVRVDWSVGRSSSVLRGCETAPVSINETGVTVDRDSTGSRNMGTLVSHGQSSLKSKGPGEVVPRL